MQESQSASSQNVAPYGVTDDDSRGRQHDDPFAGDRAPFALDRHRVLRSASFRRLEYKTQVFVIHEDDHYRTRLTHSLEVAAIARQLAVGLHVNATLAEVIALAHDLGHPPFGHAGESILGQLMSEAGGFEHNVQSLRVVDYLEHPYPPFRGLNVSFEVREGIIKHATVHDRPEVDDSSDAGLAELLADGPWPSVEGQIVCLADRLAYDCHDLEDALGADLIGENDLEPLALWRDSAVDIRRRFPDGALGTVRRPILDAIHAVLIQDVTAESQRLLAEAGVTSVDDVRPAGGPMVAVSEETNARLEALEAFLMERVYRHHRVVRMDAKARRFIERLFDAYCDNPRLLPPRFFNRVEEQGIKRVVCDYIAGMTDRFCQDEYRRLFEPFERV
ncbi:MAG: deoxyguanosinetriphosphate triphosphohydrolase [Planctomycetes bacterium]|nr:deoxyguanosinetriphosphate triphosphohydrolase [Planctomycetota bacterium]